MVTEAPTSSKCHEGRFYVKMADTQPIGPECEALVESSRSYLDEDDGQPLEECAYARQWSTENTGIASKS